MSNIFYSLGAALAHSIGREEMIGRGLLRLCIMDREEQLRQVSGGIQSTDYIQTMNYEDWKAVLEGAVLSQRLANIGVSEPTVVVDRLKQVLVDQQSLLTLTAY